MLTGPKADRGMLMKGLWKRRGRTGGFGIKKVKEERVLYKEVETSFRDLDEEIDRVFDWAFERIVGLKWPYFVIARKLEDGDLLAKICLPLQANEEVEGDEAVSVRRIPGGKFAYVRHLGSYSNLFESQQRLLEWMSEKGISKNSEEFRIVYVIGFDDTDDIEKYVTELMYEIRGVE